MSEKKRQTKHDHGITHVTLQFESGKCEAPKLV